MSEHTWRRWATIGAYGITWQSKWHIVNPENPRVFLCGVRNQYTMPYADQPAEIHPGESDPSKHWQCQRCARKAVA